jgi:hypothetical protein
MANCEEIPCTGLCPSDIRKQKVPRFARVQPQSPCKIRCAYFCQSGSGFVACRRRTADLSAVTSAANSVFFSSASEHIQGAPLLCSLEILASIVPEYLTIPFPPLTRIRRALKQHRASGESLSIHRRVADLPSWWRQECLFPIIPFF